MKTGWCYMHNGPMGSVGNSCVCGREDTDSSAQESKPDPALARKDALLRQASEALTLCERNIALIGNACNEKHVSEAIMVRAVDAQIACIDASRAAIASIQEELKGTT